jgi:ABC-2 type transport system ATP-binding protein
MTIVECEKLMRRFNGLTAVDAISFSVESGEVFGLLGPNGAGKTTTIKMLITLLAPTSGRARVVGYDVVRQAGNVRRVIGYVPQMISADGTLTGFENLLVFAKLYDIPRLGREARIREALEFMDLSEAADKLVGHYSGGMIRRLEIAQSMLHRPRILFLDEPTVGLDPIARQAVWQHIEGLRKSDGVTVFLTTHLMDEAEALCTRVAIMHLGELAVMGTVAELKASIGTREASMTDVFIHYTGGDVEPGGSYREIARGRRTARRLG